MRTYVSEDTPIGRWLLAARMSQNESINERNSSLPPNLCWRMAIAMNNERVYFNMSRDLSAIAIIAKIEKDDDTIQSLRVPVREFQSSTYDFLSHTDNTHLFFDHLGTCYTTEGCLLIEVFFSSSHQIVNCLDNIDQLRDLYQKVLSNFITQLADISTTIVIFSNLAWKLHLVTKETAERAFSLLYPVNPSIPLFHVNDPQIYKTLNQAYTELLELFPAFSGVTGKPVHFFRPNYSSESPKLPDHSLEPPGVFPISSKDVKITNKLIETEDPQNEVLTGLPDDLSPEEKLHIADNVPKSIAFNLGRALNLTENDIDNIMSQITYRKPEVLVYDILEKAQTSNLATRKHFATALLQIHYPQLAKKIDPSLKIPENILPTSDGILLVDGDLKIYDRELAHEYLKRQQSVSFWHTLHEKIALIIRSSLQSYGIQMGASFVSSFKASISLQSLHQAFQLAIDIKNNVFVALVEKEFMTLGFKGKLAVLFQINQQEVTPEVCMSLYVQAIVAKYITGICSQTATPPPAIMNESKLQQPKAMHVQMPPVVGSVDVFVPKVGKKALHGQNSVTVDNTKIMFDDKNELYFFIRKANPKAIEMINNGYTLTEPDDNGYFPIHHAAQYGNNEAIQVMLEKGINANMLTRNSDKLTPLHVAANLGQRVVVETLLIAGANIEASTSSGLTPVRLASFTNHPEVVEFLLKRGALPNACDKDGVTSLHVAVHRGNGRVVELLLEHGANALCYDNQGITPFQLVLASKKHTLLKAFLQKCPKLVKSASHTLNPPLLECCLNGGDIKMVEVMLEHGANPNEVHPEKEATSLHAACELDHVDLIELLIKHGADPTLCFPTIGTPLHHAVWMGNIRAVQKLIQLKVNLNLMNAQNISPLAKALINEKYEIALLLIDSGADVNQMATPKPGMIVYPIHMAVMRKHYKILTSIVNHNGAIDATNNEGNTALHLAVFRFQNDMVEFLCQKGANVNIQNIDGTTPLIGGVIKKNESAVMTLLNYEADINLVDNFQDSALSYAFIKQLKSVVDFLLNLGASFDVLNGKGLAAFHVACRYGEISQVALMISINLNVVASLNASSTDPPIHYALLNPPVLTFLLEQGENPNILVYNNSTPLPILYESIFNGYIKSTQILLEFGADPNAEFFIGTALHIAVSSPYATDELLTLLLNAGVKMLLGPDNVTPLLIAAEQNFLSKAKILLNYGAKVEIGKKSNGFTPLHAAAFYNHIEMTKLLLKYTNDPDTMRTKDGLTPLFIAVIQENYEILDMFAAKKCNIDTQDGIYGNTPLIHVLRQKKVQMAQKLMSLGANVNVANNCSATPLIVASAYESQFASTLIDAGADITAQTEDGISSLHIAVVENDDALLTKLIEKGVSLNFKTSDHPSPLHYAVKGENMSALKIFTSHGATVDDMGGLLQHTSNEEIKQLLRNTISSSLKLTEKDSTPKMQQLTRAEIFKKLEPLYLPYFNQENVLNEDVAGLQNKLSNLSPFQDILVKA